MTDRTLELAMQLIARPSITPRDEGCQDLLVARLQAIGFTVERLPFGEVQNFWASRGNGTPLVVLAGHTDVVPPGPRDAWKQDPFSPTVHNGFLYGRGAADMKSSLAAFVTALESYSERHPRHRGSIGVLVTSDEEGPATEGTVKVMQWLSARGQQITHCLVGEPTSSKTLGDVIKNGRRGSLNGRLRVLGTQGHVAYPHLAHNPIHAGLSALQELVTVEWDRGNEFFPRTTFQISNMHAGTGADNVIPGVLELQFNFRFGTASTQDALRARLERILQDHGVQYEIAWTLSGEPYLTRGTTLIKATQRAIRETLGVEAALSTDGGTSDGRFIAPAGAEVVEFGPMNSTIHKANECVAVSDLARLARTYGLILEYLLA